MWPHEVGPHEVGPHEVGPHEVGPHEVGPWFHSWYRGRVETLDPKYNLSHSVTVLTVQREPPRYEVYALSSKHI